MQGKEKEAKKPKSTPSQPRPGSGSSKHGLRSLQGTGQLSLLSETQDAKVKMAQVAELSAKSKLALTSSMLDEMEGDDITNVEKVILANEAQESVPWASVIDSSMPSVPGISFKGKIHSPDKPLTEYKQSSDTDEQHDEIDTRMRTRQSCKSCKRKNDTKTVMVKRLKGNLEQNLIADTEQFADCSDVNFSKLNNDFTIKDEFLERLSKECHISTDYDPQSTIDSKHYDQTICPVTELDNDLETNVNSVFKINSPTTSESSNKNKEDQSKSKGQQRNTPSSIPPSSSSKASGSSEHLRPSSRQEDVMIHRQETAYLFETNRQKDHLAKEHSIGSVNLYYHTYIRVDGRSDESLLVDFLKTMVQLKRLICFERKAFGTQVIYLLYWPYDFEVNREIAKNSSYFVSKKAFEEIENHQTAIEIAKQEGTLPSNLQDPKLLEAIKYKPVYNFAN